MAEIEPPRIHRMRLKRSASKRNMILAVAVIITMIGAAIAVPLIVLAVAGPEPAGGTAVAMSVLSGVISIFAAIVAVENYTDFQDYDIDLKEELHKTAWKEHQARRAELDQIIAEDLQSGLPRPVDEQWLPESRLSKAWKQYWEGRS